MTNDREFKFLLDKIKRNRNIASTFTVRLPIGGGKEK